MAPAGPFLPLLASVEADDAVSDAQNRVDHAEESDAHALEGVDREVGSKQRAANAAYAQLSDAQLAQRAWDCVAICCCAPSSAARWASWSSESWA